MKRTIRTMKKHTPSRHFQIIGLNPWNIRKKGAIFQENMPVICNI